MNKLWVLLLLCISIRTPGQVSQTISIKEGNGSIEIFNGLAGIVVPSKQGLQTGQRFHAPIKAFIFRNKIYSDNSPNFLEATSQPYSADVKFISRTPLEVRVQIVYYFQKKRFPSSNKKYYNSGEGKGFYNCKITIRKGDPYIMIEEETDYDISYSVKISNGLSPDKARYRGFLSDNIKYGYEPSGTMYRRENERGFPMDATVDISYDVLLKYPRLTLWEPEGGEGNTGRYWQLFNSKGDENANLFGFFQGRPSRLIGAMHVGPALQVKPDDPVSRDKQIAELNISIERRGPDDSWFPRKRFEWGVFISTKRDVLSPEQTQPIARTMNKASGLASRIGDYASRPAKIIPAFYTGSIYMEASKISGLIKAVKNDKSFYVKLVQTEPGFKPIWDVWRFPDSVSTAVHKLLNFRLELEKEYVSGEGSYKSELRYWKGVRLFKFQALLISALFADKSNFLKAEEKRKLEQLIPMMARILWDDNNTPLFDSSGVNLGPENMQFQYRNNGRTFFALILANDPEFSTRAKNISKATNADINNAIGDNGISFGSPHYIQATIDPILFSALQLKQAGISDLFRSNKKLEAFANFYLTLLTPPSCRFENNRKLISFGDGSEESAATFCLLSAGLRQVNRNLSKSLLWAYHFGPPRSSFTTPVSFVVDLLEIPEWKFQISSSNFQGYLSHFRTDANSDKESGLWILNGDALRDHRNDDAGEVSIYALGAPLSLSRSSFYYPHATDSRIRSVVIPESIFPEWNSNAQPIAGRSLTNRTWPLSGLNEFANLGYAAMAQSMMKTKEGKTWTRTIFSISVHEELPVYIFNDSVSGSGKNIWSMPMMSEGAVRTRVGPITPEKRMHNNGNLQQLPSATPVKTIPAGWNQFVFNGQHWKTHFAGGIDWDLYSYSSQPMNFSMAQWGTNWQNSTEQNEFKRTNGRDYIEEQQIVRLQSSEPFFTVLIPYPKKSEVYQNSVDLLAGKQIQMKQGTDELMLSASGMMVQNKQGGIIALLSANKKIVQNGFSIEGGIAGIDYKKTGFTIRVHGNSGMRKIMVPFKKTVPSKSYTGLTLRPDKNGTLIIIDYKNNTTDLPAGEKGYSEYIFTVPGN